MSNSRNPAFGIVWWLLLLAISGLMLHVSTGTAQAEVERIPNTGGVTLDGLFSVSPDKKTIDVVPGSPTTFRMRLQNRMNKTVTLEISTTDLAAAEDPSALITVVHEGEFGAGDWLTPEITTATLAPGEEVAFDVTVLAPLDAPVGTNFAGVVIDVASSANDEASGTSAGVKISGLAQIYLTVPGELRHDVKIVSATITDSFIFHGSGFVTYELTVENKGNVNDNITGETLIKSMFGNTVRVIDIRDHLVLRGAKRTIRIIWPDPPLFGRFTGEARLKMLQDTQTKELPTVTVFPPLWWFFVAAAALLLPLGYWLYQRLFGWKRYLDEDWDEDEGWDEDEEWNFEQT